MDRDVGERIELLVDLEGWAPESVRARMEGLLDLARDHLESLARRGLSSTADKYVKGIKPWQIDATASGRLVGVLEVAPASGSPKDLGDAGLTYLLEHGSAPWDLRHSLLPGRDPKTLHYDAEGFMYRNIPFRHGVPSSPETRHHPMLGTQFTREGQRNLSRAHRGELDRRASARLAGDVHRAAGALNPTRSAPGAKTQWGGRLDAGLAPILRARHVTDIYAGMVRMEKTYERATQNTYMTFRRISTNPKTHRYDPATVRLGGHPAGASNVMGQTMERNWTHPGFAARNFVRQTSVYVGSLLSSGAIFGSLEGEAGA